jgi:hypothetical protein
MKFHISVPAETTKNQDKPLIYSGFFFFQGMERGMCLQKGIFDLSEIPYFKQTYRVVIGFQN